MLHGLSGIGQPQNLIQPPSREFIGLPQQTRKQTQCGTHRVRSLEDTLFPARTAAEKAGTSRLADITGLDCVGIPVFTSVRPQAEVGNLTITGGKGQTPLAAEISALLEAVERYCGERNNRFGTVASFAEIGRQGIALEARSLILAPDSGYQDEAAIEWWSARDLLSGNAVLVPAAAVFHPYERPPYLFASSSNGLACGNSLPEAVLHALLEVIERDATAFGETLADGQVLDLERLSDANCRSMVQKFIAAGLQVRVSVFATEIGIPTFYATIDDIERRDPMLINGGFGCHLNPNIGLSRALSEAALSRATVIAGVRDDLDSEQVKRKIGYDAFKSHFSQWFEEREPTVKLEQLPDLSTPSISEDICIVLQSLERAGFERVLAVDLSLPEIDFAVVRAIVPGCEFYHIDRQRMGPRLRQRMGVDR